MIPTYLIPLANHLWQSTGVACVAAIFALLLRKQRASVRYWLWLTASMKFLVPFSMLASFGAFLVSSSAPVIAPTPASSLAVELGQPFALPVPAPLLETVPGLPSALPTFFFAVWLCGAVVSAACWFRAWLRIRSAVRLGSPLPQDRSCNCQMINTPACIEPCVFGIFRPVLLLPEGIENRLTPEQLEAILLHEICHVKRRDNLAAAIHLIVETLFWFYPVVYWVGKRLLEERELACDEEVLRTVPWPEAYAQGILAVCRFGLQPSPIAAAGVAGSNLSKRIEKIMTYRPTLHVGWRQRLLLALTGFAVLTVPFLSGVFFVGLRAQVAGGPYRFEVASVHANKTGAMNSGFRRFQGGELNTTNITLMMLIAFAYDIAEDRILQAPSWLDSEKYDILAKPDRSGDQPVDNSRGLVRLRTQTLLAEIFHLKLHKETRESKIYRLVVEKGGPKNLNPPKTTKQDLVSNGRHVSAWGASMDSFAKIFLTPQMGAPVINQTGLTGVYDLTMDWSPDDSAPRRRGNGPDRAGPPESSVPLDSMGPSFLVALREQLGLKLEAGKGPVEFLVVDHAEKASENQP